MRGRREGEVCKQSRAPPWQPGVRVMGVLAWSFPRVDARSVLSQVRDAFMVTDSFHLSRPFTPKSQLPVEKKKKKSSLDSSSSSPLAAAVDSSAQESPPQRSHPFKPASRRRGPAPLPAWAARLPARPQGLKTTKRLFNQHARFSQKCSPLLRSLPWRRPTVCVCFSWREFW